MPFLQGSMDCGKLTNLDISSDEKDLRRDERMGWSDFELTNWFTREARMTVTVGRTASPKFTHLTSGPLTLLALARLITDVSKQPNRLNNLNNRKHNSDRYTGPRERFEDVRGDSAG
ncbi:hypothetical protein EVAR_4997_1 [Eumeta japonica]|uniref:Uncharacterized protein n=1 Tax=Eumeta variegata TaxID=151549 RepID=A0A4C1UZ60_EUMVA|nr:hypothetical protein EVAR_4997_1 [Eumeta japonica]